MPHRGAGLVAALALVAALTGGPAAAADRPPSLGALRAERGALLVRIAGLTDAALAAQARAADAADRRALAQLAVEDARRRVAGHAVEAYIDAVDQVQVDQLRRQGWADVIATTDRYLLAVLDDTRAKAQAEEEAAEQAVADARIATEQLQQVRAALERTIGEREAADRAAAEARRKATAELELRRAPRHLRTTRAQAELFARYPFGPVQGIPPGLVATGEVFAGRASWYGPGFDGRPTASGAIFDQEGMTVAHRTLPLGTILRITRGGRSVLVLVNDRGPFVAGRVLDLSHGVAQVLGTVRAGVAHVTSEVLVEG